MTHPPTDTGAIGAERSVLTGLLARVEAASGPDRELEARIWCAFTPNRQFLCIAGRDTRWGEFEENAFNPKGSPGAGMLVFRRLDYAPGDDRRAGGPGAAVQAFSGYPAYTASLDAALALCERVLPDCVLGVRQRFVPDWVAETYQRETGRQTHAVSKTPAVALVSAMLRALLAQAPSPATTPTGVLETSLIVEGSSNDASET